MQLNSSSTYKSKALAALAASFLATSAPARADGLPLVATSSDLHPLYVASGASLDVLIDGPIYMLVEADGQQLPAPSLTRETTDQEHLIATLRHLEHNKADWDGEGALAPIVSSLRAASDFVCALPPSNEMPEPLLHASGHAGLSWSRDDYYGELEFLDDGRVAYYFVIGEDKHKGVVALDDRHTVPRSLEPLLIA